MVCVSRKNVVWFAILLLRSSDSSYLSLFILCHCVTTSIWTWMPFVACAHMTQVKPMCFIVGQDGNRRSGRGLMFQHTVRMAAYQQSAKKPRWSLNVMTWHYIDIRLLKVQLENINPEFWWKGFVAFVYGVETTVISWNSVKHNDFLKYPEAWTCS